MIIIGLWQQVSHWSSKKVTIFGHPSFRGELAHNALYYILQLSVLEASPAAAAAIDSVLHTHTQADNSSPIIVYSTYIPTNITSYIYSRGGKELQDSCGKRAGDLPWGGRDRYSCCKRQYGSNRQRREFLFSLSLFFLYHLLFFYMIFISLVYIYYYKHHAQKERFTYRRELSSVARQSPSLLFGLYTTSLTKLSQLMCRVCSICIYAESF